VRIAITTGAFALLFSIQAMADEPPASSVASDHVLGRVFMSDVERRKLDLLRKVPRSTGGSGPADAASQSTEAAIQNKPQPVGYIVPSNGRPYEWIDGDFRHVTDVAIDSIDNSQMIHIIRHVDGSPEHENSPDVQAPGPTEKEDGLEAEVSDANRSPH